MPGHLIEVDQLGATRLLLGHPPVVEGAFGHAAMVGGTQGGSQMGFYQSRRPHHHRKRHRVHRSTLDPYLRAFDTTTGKELWEGKLPASARSTPMTYQSPKGRQFVVISANGHNIVSDSHDEIVAFALPD
jgi:PQQ enzyme-like repeat protein